ncbi:major capsid protein [Brucella phage BiPBO1]|uniref:major head protein n=1 Tax=Brucella phage BiPBO1 TaxID=1718278 RepID=UPI0002D3C882|nr:phage major capsid protein [Brucella inopinata]YP_009304034.1 major head protein [Brucella phage BiPBO1]ALJ98220.1 major capsid protein [Brucella phage BiPBO1]
MTKHFNSRKVRGIVAVRAETSDIKAAIDGVNRAFEEFKAEHTKEIKDIKAGLGDVVQTEKVDRINEQLGVMSAAIDELNVKMALGNVPSKEGENETAEMKEYKADFNEWVRTGEGEGKIRSANKSGVMASMSVGSNPDGGYTAPVEWDRQITDKLALVSPMRRFASIQNVRGQGFKHLYNMHGAGSGWVGETDARAETATPKFAEYSFKFGEIYATPGVTQILLEDSEIDIASYLAGEVDLEFAQQEGVAFLSGDGVNKPKGVLMYDATAEGALQAGEKHPLGPVLEVNTGDAAALTADGIIDLVYAIPSERITPSSAFYLNRKTHSVVRKMKDGQDNYLWQPPYQAGQPAQILGYATHELSGMPDVAANAIPVIFGDMAQGYRIFDRLGVQVLRDPYTKKPYVLFYTRKRVGGGLWNPEFIRYHRVAAA